MRYRLRTLLILVGVLPPLLAVGWWKHATWKAKQERQRARHEMVEALHLPYPLTDITEQAGSRWPRESPPSAP